MLAAGELRAVAKKIVEQLKQAGGDERDIERLARELILLASYDSAVDLSTIVKKI